MSQKHIYGALIAVSILIMVVQGDGGNQNIQLLEQDQWSLEHAPYMHIQAVGDEESDTAWVTPAEVEARQLGSWTFTYVPRGQGFSSGGEIVLHVPFGYSAALKSWTYPQVSSATRKGFVKVGSSNPGTQFVSTIAQNGYDYLVQITFSSVLPQPGDTIRITYGDTTQSSAGSAASNVFAREYPFPIMVRKTVAGGYHSVTPDPCVRVVARTAKQFHIVAPSTLSQGEIAAVKLVALDEYNNRDKLYRGTLLLSCGDDSECGIEGLQQFAVEDSGRLVVEFLSSPGQHQIVAVDSTGNEYWGNPFIVTDSVPEYRLFWADLHNHTDLSDGNGTLEEALSFAKEVANLDVVAITDHDYLHQTDYLKPEVWNSIVEVSNRYNGLDRFAALIGYEWTQENGEGHRHVLYRSDHGQPISHRAYPTVADLCWALEDTRALVTPHHVAWKYVERPIDWSYRNDVYQRMVEIYSQHAANEYYLNPLDHPTTACAPGHYVRDALALGHRLGIIASSDGHYGYPGHGWVWGVTALDSTSRGTGLTGIYAEELTREAIFDALEARRVFATTDHRTILDFRINGARMGSEISSDSIPVIQGSVFSQTPIDTVELVKYDDRGYRIEQLIADHSTRHYEFSMVDTLFDRDSFYYLRVVSEGNLNNRFAWSSPIWVNKHIHQSPIISALPELTILEDDSLTIQVCDWYSCVEDADTPDSLLTWGITSRNTHIDIQKDIRPYNFVICADPDWWGVDTLTVIVSDEKRRDSTRLALHVLPVNDPPKPFGLVSPVDSSMIHIPIGELRRRSIKLEWEPSIDIESDEFWYYAKLTSPDGPMVRSPDISFPGCIISLSGLWEEPRVLDSAQHLSWNVAAMDGEDTSWSADGARTH
ncbi:CehA/McbA family metallohydrolase [Candidatus Neomarinimicrobiota bacterium]